MITWPDNVHPAQRSSNEMMDIRVPRLQVGKCFDLMDGVFQATKWHWQLGLFPLAVKGLLIILVRAPWWFCQSSGGAGGRSWCHCFGYHVPVYTAYDEKKTTGHLIAPYTSLLCLIQRIPMSPRDKYFLYHVLKLKITCILHKSFVTGAIKI